MREKGIDCAHTLKGVFANMGITPLMFETVVKIVEPLRAGKNDGLMPVQYEELLDEREHLRSIIQTKENKIREDLYDRYASIEDERYFHRCCHLLQKTENKIVRLKKRKTGADL